MKLTVRLPNKVSTNNYYGMHWGKRNNVIHEFHEEVFAELNKNKVKVDNYPVTLDFTFYLTGRPLDWVNLSAMAKMTEDALVRCGVLENDSPQYVSEGTLRWAKSPHKHNYCELVIKTLK